MSIEKGNLLLETMFCLIVARELVGVGFPTSYWTKQVEGETPD